MNFIARTGTAMKSPAAGSPPSSAAGDTYYSIATDLLRITDQFELMRTALIHAVNMTEQGRAMPLDLALAIMRSSADRIQEVSTRAKLRLMDDDLDKCTLVYGERA